jgi:hypothetical protein
MSVPDEQFSAADLDELRRRAAAVQEIAGAALLADPNPDLEAQARLADDLRSALGSDNLVDRFLGNRTGNE